MFGGELEKKVACALDCIGKGAAALSEAGNVVYTMSHAMQNQGLSGLLQQDVWKEATPSAPNLTPNRAQSPRKSAPQVVPQDADEKRAVLLLRLERVMREQDVSRVQEISRELDDIDSYVKDKPSVNKPTMGKSTMDKPIMNEPTIDNPGVDRIRHVQPPTDVQLRPPANRHAPDDDTPLPPPNITESAPMAGTPQIPPTPFFPSCCWHSSYPPACSPLSYPPHWPPGYLPSYPSNFANCSPCCPYTMPIFGYSHGFGDTGRFANPQSGNIPSNVSARMTKEPLPRAMESKSHAIVVGTTTPQASGSIVVHEAVPLSQTTHISTETLQTNFARGSSPPRVEEVHDIQHFRECKQISEARSFHLPASGDTVHALSSLASPAPFPTGLPPGGLSSALSSRGQSSEASYRDLFLEDASDAPVGLLHPFAQTLSLKMRSDAQEEKATPLQKPVVVPQPQKCHLLSDSDDDPIGSSLKGIYEVETLLDMRETADGEREFLIKWKGWGTSWNNWEPEHNILDRRLLRKFDKKKKRPVEAASLQGVDDFTVHSKRRCAKQAAVKARVAARNEHQSDA